ncbi:hypothetical protein DL93DRAFT_2124628 [Clavulina sp. PMI_390]|nr:hypothetical protein DL93DRAFT_2124628 [Clavulina sp. PMI_390]
MISIMGGLQIVVKPYKSTTPPPLWRESLVIPAYFAALSALVLILSLVWHATRHLRARLFPKAAAASESVSETPTPSHASIREREGIIAEIKSTIKSHGILAFVLRCLRLASTLALVALTIVAFIYKEEAESENPPSYDDVMAFLKGGKKRRRQAQALHRAEWMEIIQLATYCYASLLGLLALTLPLRPRRIAALHVSLLLFVVFAVYFVRDLWPLATYTLSPIDSADGWLTWSRVSVVSFAGVLIPLLMPREYIPIDPSNPNDFNGEQTASPLQMMAFTFLDITVYHAWKHPHLPYELLPALCDYDHARYLRELSFDTIMPKAGRKNLHLAFRLLRLFKWEFAFMAFCMTLRTILGFLNPIAVNQLLQFIEKRGADAYIRPWVWIVALFFSPILSSILLQLYIFTSTGSLVRAESFLTQLVFEHALRIRMKEAAPKTDATSAPTTPRTQILELPETEGEVPEVDADAASTTTGAQETGAASTTAVAESTNGDSSDPNKKSTPPPAAPSPAPAKPDDDDSGGNLAGRINNLISTDLENITDSRDFMFLVIYAPLQTVLCIWFLYEILGWSSFLGMGVMLLSLGAPVQIGKVTHGVQVKRMKATDARVQTVTEILGVVRMLKMFGWEAKMGQQLKEKREEELGWIKKRFYLDLLNQNVNWILPLLTMLVTFFSYTVLEKKALSASAVFSSLTVFDSLRDQLHFVFWAIPNLIQGKTELLDQFTENATVAAEFVPPTADPSAIGFHNAVFTWGIDDASRSGSGSSTPTPLTPSRRKFTLRVEGDLRFKPGVFNIIVGPTGSGKTSLLLALLGELHFAPPGPDSWFNLPREKGIAYAAQEAWVLNETIKENIVFGSKFDEARYKATLTQCALDRDMELFSAGDETEVGEKGLTLSGGQKARISLARAVYSNAEIVLLDDVLSALDVHTARWVVDKCFSGPSSLLAGRTVILVTHNVAMAGPLAKNVVEIASDGTISQKDSIAAVLSENPEVRKEAEQDAEAIAKDGETVDEAKPAEPPAAASGKLIADEEVALGRVSVTSMMLYFANMGGTLFWTSFWGFLIGVELLNIILSWWLGVWAHQYEIMEDSKVSVSFYLGSYTGIVVWFLTLVIGVVRASRKIHELLVQSILTTTLRFLDKTPAGRIVARFTRDIRAVDGPLANNLEAVASLSASLVMKLLAIVYFTPIFLWPGLAFGFFAYVLGRIYIAAQLSVKREMSNARSPVFSHLGASIGGLTSIRAYGVEDRFKDESLNRIDKYTRPARAFYNLNRWIGVRIDALGGIFAAGLASYLIYVSKSTSASDTGLLLNLSVGFTGMLIWWVRCLNELEVTGNSLERIEAYLDIDHEPPFVEERKPPAAWPTSGDLVIEKLGAKYSEDGPEVLHSLAFTIKSGEKVGVVGRTGSGKSSLTLALLRLIPTSGEVLYDGLPTSKLNLEDLRRAITIIPQQPELISGTIRQNLDPFDEHDDLILNDALRSAGLFSLQKDLPDEERISLDTPVSSGGAFKSLVDGSGDKENLYKLVNTPAA